MFGELLFHREERLALQRHGVLEQQHVLGGEAALGRGGQVQGRQQCVASRKPENEPDRQVNENDHPKPHPVVRLARWGMNAYLVYLGLGALFVLGLFVSDGAWWAIPLFAFFAFVAYVQIRNRRSR